MQLINPTAVTHALGGVSSIIQNLATVSKPVRKFLVWIIEHWISLPLRHNFTSLARTGGYCEKAIRHHFSRKLPFIVLFHQLFGFLRKKTCIAVFDPTFIAKSGSHTTGLGKFWDGSASRINTGLEANCLAIVDTEARTAYSMEVTQTPSADGQRGTRTDAYCSIISGRAADILKYTTILAVDAYFMKKTFVDTVCNAGLQLITRTRVDADMKYLYHGPKHSGKGRQKKFAGKVDFTGIDKRRWRKIYEDDEVIGYEAVLWAMRLKREVKVVYVLSKTEVGYQLLVSTDLQLDGATVIEYYRLRFQIEFLIRDAKLHCGMEQCQARSAAKLYNHWNIAMSTVSIMKGFVWRQQRRSDKEAAFSMQAIKSVMINKMLTESIFSNLALDLSSKKIKRLYDQCLAFGIQAA